MMRPFLVRARTWSPVWIGSAVAFLCACESLQSMDWLNGLKKPSIESIVPRITGIDLEGVKMALDVGVKNPYGVALKSPRFKYQLDIADRPFVTDEQATRVDLPAASTGNLTLPIHMNYADLWNSYRQFKNANEVPYTLKGQLLLAPLGKQMELPLQTSGKLPILRLPKFSDINLAQPEVGMGQAKVALDMLVSNPNVFALGLEKLGYQLKIGDLEVGSILATAPRDLAPGKSEKVHLSGTLSGLDAIGKIMSGSRLGAPRLTTIGSIRTPYGAVKTP